MPIESTIKLHAIQILNSLGAKILVLMNYILCLLKNNTQLYNVETVAAI
jgi:hypothetical protein